MGFFIDCHFLFEVQLLCLSLHIEVLSFEDCGAVDARKLSAKWRNRYISDIFFSLGFNRGAKAAEAARNICDVYGDNAKGRERQ